MKSMSVFSCWFLISNKLMIFLGLDDFATDLVYILYVI